MKKIILLALFAFSPLAASATEPPAAQSPLLGITLFFEADGALAKETANIPRDKLVENEMKSSMDRLAAGSATLEPVLAKSVKLETVFLGADRIAYLNFNENFVADHPGGITQEIITLAGVCQTVFSNFDVDGIRLLAKGKEIKSVAGHVDIESAISRAQCDRFLQYRKE